MELDPKICEIARLSRDARFDGRFFVGVLTTGIYCRPVCPAPAPKPENVRYFPTAAAAAREGLRPCLRCRPETSPGTPTWSGSSQPVSRALALIEAGALDDGSVEDVARRLEMTPRHLSRLFRQHLGASPVSIAQTRRLLFAKKLLDETDLAVSEVAFASGFGSLRRFNAAFRSTYQRTPTDVRRASPAVGDTLSERRSGFGLILELAYRPPFDWAALTRFLQPRAIPGVEVVTATSYRRTISVGNKEGWLEVRPHEKRSCLELLLSLPEPGNLLSIVSRIRRLFDLGADPAEINSVLVRSSLLRKHVLTRPGTRVPGAWDGFELAVRAILGQQVTVRGATTLVRRLVERYGTSLPKPGPGDLAFLFPTPETLVDGDLETIGLPGTRASAVRRLAAAVLDGTVSFEPTVSIEASLDRLARLPGVGDWTAQYIALRALGEPDAFPASDLGLRRAAISNGPPPTPAALRRTAKAWRPWRGYAAMHLWNAASRLQSTRERSSRGDQRTR